MELNRIPQSLARSFVTGILILWNVSCQARGVPETLPAAKARSELSPAYMFSVRGIAFFKNRLYAGSGLGLLEISDGAVKAIHRWDKTSTAVTSPVHDTANNLLWVQISGQHQLAYYDGTNWQTVNKPEPKHGYVPQGDAWEGFRCASNTRKFYYQGGGHAWVWQQTKWLEQDNPPTQTNKRNPIGLLDRLIVADDHCYFIIRDEREPIRAWTEIRKNIGVHTNFNGNSVYYLKDAHWNLVTNAATAFLSEETLAVGSKGYIRTTEGCLLDVNEARIACLTAPGICEAIAKSERGTLLASFRGQGVYELSGAWRKLLPAPYTDVAKEHKVRLTAAGNRIALAVEETSSFSAESPTNISLIPIWISNGEKWQQMKFPF